MVMDSSNQSKPRVPFAGAMQRLKQERDQDVVKTVAFLPPVARRVISSTQRAALQHDGRAAAFRTYEREYTVPYCTVSCS